MLKLRLSYQLLTGILLTLLMLSISCAPETDEQASIDTESSNKSTDSIMLGNFELTGQFFNAYLQCMAQRECRDGMAHSVFGEGYESLKEKFREGREHAEEYIQNGSNWTRRKHEAAMEYLRRRFGLE